MVRRINSIRGSWNLELLWWLSVCQNGRNGEEAATLFGELRWVDVVKLRFGASVKSDLEGAERHRIYLGKLLPLAPEQQAGFDIITLPASRRRTIAKHSTLFHPML
jgi:hypothetical protein